MQTRWHVETENLPQDDRDAFHSMEALLRRPMEQITLDVFSGVSRLSLQKVYFVKVFPGRSNWLRHLFGISRYQRELSNLAYFSSLGLNTPLLVAHGDRTWLGLLNRAIMVTGEVADSTDLYKLVKSGCFYRRGVYSARRILKSLAEATRQMHADGFYHRDLKPRNILVRFEGDEPKLYFFDCPKGYRPSRLRFRRCVVRELAHIERDLRGRVRRSDLMYLFKQYCGCDRLSSENKALAREALTYYAERRMTSKRRKRLERRRRREKRRN